jgi:hypothetical protein
MEDYGSAVDKTDAIDKMQRDFQCCGTTSYEDWQFSQWKLSAQNNKV